MGFQWSLGFAVSLGYPFQFYCEAFPDATEPVAKRDITYLLDELKRETGTIYIRPEVGYNSLGTQLLLVLYEHPTRCLYPPQDVTPGDGRLPPEPSLSKFRDMLSHGRKAAGQGELELLWQRVVDVPSDPPMSESHINTWNKVVEYERAEREKDERERAEKERAVKEADRTVNMKRAPAVYGRYI